MDETNILIDNLQDQILQDYLDGDEIKKPSMCYFIKIDGLWQKTEDKIFWKNSSLQKIRTKDQSQIDFLDKFFKAKNKKSKG